MKKLTLLLFLSLILILGLGQVAFAETACETAKCKPSCGTGETPDTTKTCTPATPANVCCKTETSTTPCTNCKATCADTEEPDASKTCPTSTPTKTCCKAKSTGGTSTPDVPGGTGQVDILPETGGGAKEVSFKPEDLSPPGDLTVPELIGMIIKGALGIVGSISLLIFVYGGYMMLISQGDPGKIKKGKDAMVWATIGLLMIFGSFIFVNFIVTELSRGK